MTYQHMHIDIVACIKKAEQNLEEHRIWKDQNLDTMCALIGGKDHNRGLYYL